MAEDDPELMYAVGEPGWYPERPYPENFMPPVYYVDGEAVEAIPMIDIGGGNFLPMDEVKALIGSGSLLWTPELEAQWLAAQGLERPAYDPVADFTMPPEAGGAMGDASDVIMVTMAGTQPPGVPTDAPADVPIYYLGAPGPDVAQESIGAPSGFDAFTDFLRSLGQSLTGAFGAPGPMTPTAAGAAAASSPLLTYLIIGGVIYFAMASGRKR